jgi:large subunit ribosomal protein L21
MYAVIETGGKQYRVEVGTELAVELLEAEDGQSITLDRVLLVADGEQTAVGQPLVASASVAADVVRQVRGDKVISFKYRPKARRRVTRGHRQELTLLRISDIVFDGRSAAADVRKREEAARSERERVEEAARRQAAADAELAAQLAAKTPAKPATRATGGETGGASTKPGGAPVGRGTRAPKSATKSDRGTVKAAGGERAKPDTARAKSNAPRGERKPRSKDAGERADDTGKDG